MPLLLRPDQNRAEDLRSDDQALRRGWETARLLRMNSRGQIRFDDAGLLLEPATTLAAEPVPSAVFLGVVEDEHLWAVRDNELTGSLL